jgi:hypothetical protein
LFGNAKIKMITIAEYRAWAEESLKWAGEATTANERDAYIKIAEVWLQSALRSERLSALRSEPLSKEADTHSRPGVGAAPLSRMTAQDPSQMSVGFDNLRSRH